MRENCGFIRSNGRPCGNPAGMGTSHLGQGFCHLHDVKPARQMRRTSPEGGTAASGRRSTSERDNWGRPVGGPELAQAQPRRRDRPAPRRQDPPNAPKVVCGGCKRAFVAHCPECDEPAALKMPSFWGTFWRGENPRLQCTACGWTGNSATCPHCSATTYTEPAYRCPCCGATTRGRPGLCAACQTRQQNLVAQGARQGVRAVQRCPVCTATVPAPCPNCGKPVVLERPDGINNAITGGALGMLMDSTERRFQKQNNYFQCRLCNWWGTEVKCPMCGKAIYARDW